jgi:hypothetical protein
VRRYEDELRAGTVNVRKRERTDREKLEASIRRE